MNSFHLRSCWIYFFLPRLYFTAHMDEAMAELAGSLKSADVEHITKLLDIILERSKDLDTETKSRYILDSHLKQLLRKHPSIEIIEKIGDLFPLVRDPRNFYDELIDTLSYKLLILPSLMLIFHISSHFDFVYDDFYVKLEETVTEENVKSEGYLLFVLRCLDNRNIELGVVERFLKRFSQLSITVPSDVCVRIVYCMLVLMRIHPASFQFADSFKELTVLSRAVGPIKAITHQIFTESKYPERRPKAIFLNNFTFPMLYIEKEEP